MVRCAALFTLLALGLSAMTGCASRAAEPNTAATEQNRTHDPAWNPGEETTFSMEEETAPTGATGEELTKTTMKPNREKIPHGVVHAAVR